MSRQEFKTANSATVAEIQAANERTIQNIKNATPPPGTICPAGYLVHWGQAEIMDYAGIYRIDRDNTEMKDDECWLQWPLNASGTEYGAKQNPTNRKMTKDQMHMLLRHAIAETFVVTGEACIRDSLKFLASAQHRMGACFVATLLNPEARFYFIIQDGIDPLLVDYIDTPKSRTNKDVGGRHKDSFFPESVLRNLSGLPYGKQVGEVRKTCISDATSAISRIWLRGRGEDINGSTTQYKHDKSQFDRMVARFPIVEIENPTTNGVEVLEITTLERAANLIYARDKEGGGALNRYFGRGNVLTALVLASNTDNPSDVRVESVTSTTGRSTSTVVVEYPEEMACDLQLVEDFCRMAIDKTGPMRPVYDWLDQKRGKINIAPQYKFGALVNSLKFFIENREETVLPAKLNEAGEVVSPEKTIVSCPDMPSSMVPKTPKAKIVGGKEIVPPLKYPHFGGYDCGKIDSKQLKANAELEELVEEESEAAEAMV
jgi:hypothetical protein